MKPIPVLESSRLLLKGISPDFIHYLYQNHDQNYIQNLFNFDEKDYEHFKNMHLKGMETSRFSLFFFLLVLKDGEVPVGDCGFHTWYYTHDKAEVFYYLRREEDKRKGLMSEALPLVLKYGFTQMNLHRIEAKVSSTNEASIKLLKKNNFTFEGTLREDYLRKGNYENSDLYSLLKNELVL